MHSPKASALRNLDRYCITRARHIKTRGASSVCYNDFSAVTVTSNQSERETSQSSCRWEAVSDAAELEHQGKAVSVQ